MFLKAEGTRITVCLHLCHQTVLPTFNSNTKLWWVNGTQCMFNLYSVSEVEHLFKELFLSFFFFLCTRSPFLNSYKDIGLFLCDLIGAFYILGNLTLCNLSCTFFFPVVVFLLIFKALRSESVHSTFRQILRAVLYMKVESYL